MTFVRAFFGTQAVYVLADTVEDAIDTATVFARQEYEIADPLRYVEEFTASVTRSPVADRNWRRIVDVES
jgi:dTDP-glucose pyrophosphorylase